MLLLTACVLVFGSEFWTGGCTFGVRLLKWIVELEFSVVSFLLASLLANEVPISRLIYWLVGLSTFSFFSCFLIIMVAVS